MERRYIEFENFMFLFQVEATEVFFAVTKLFQSNDAGLRRLVYLMIKELSPSSDEVKNYFSDG
jgi:hypothetical protein